MTTKSEWQNVSRELIAEARERLGEPPTAEEMAAYMRGQMTEAESERIRELLVAYPELAAAYAAPFPEAPQPGDDDYLSDEEVTAGWNALQQQRRVPGTDSNQVLPFRRWVPAALAAALALVFAGLFWQAESRARQYRAELDRPMMVGKEIALSPDVGRRGPGESPKLVTTDGDAYRFVPALRGRPHYAHYRVSIVRLPGEKTVWTRTDLERGDDDTFELIVPRRFVSAGDYEIRIFGLDGQRAAALDVYGFRIP